MTSERRRDTHGRREDRRRRRSEKRSEDTEAIRTRKEGMRMMATEFMDLIMQEVVEEDPLLKFQSTLRNAADVWSETFREELLKSLRSEIKRRVSLLSFQVIIP